MRKMYLFLMLGIFLVSCHEQSKTGDEDTFTFAFLTDIHAQPEKNAMQGFQQAINKVNELNPDFVITGGDLIMDALGASHGRADSLYNIYDSMQGDFNMPVYNTMGNHEVYGIYESSKADSLHPEFGEKMYEQRLGERYYSFDHEGWHFMILDAIEEPGHYYIGEIDSVQMSWIRKDLASVDQSTPVVISTHIPFITAMNQFWEGPTAEVKDSWVVTNAHEVLKLYQDHNLQLVLQGHLHIYEDIYINGIHFITGGAVSGAWWSGPNRGTEEGFLLVESEQNSFDSEYIDYGWEVKKPEK